MKPVVVINGVGGVGKDTFINLCSNMTKVLNVSTVDIIKEAATILGWKGTKEEIDRKFLSDLKQLSLGYNDFPFKYAVNKIMDFYHQDYYRLMFIHSREIAEIQRFRDQCRCWTLLISSNRVAPLTSNISDSSEVFNYLYDYTIDNSGTLRELEDKAYEFVRGLIP